MLAASNMSRITLLKSSFSFGVSSHLVRGSLSFTSSSASIFSLFGFICRAACCACLRLNALRRAPVQLARLDFGPVDDVAHAPILESVTRVPVTVGPPLKRLPDTLIGNPAGKCRVFGLVLRAAPDVRSNHSVGCIGITLSKR